MNAVLNLRVPLARKSVRGKSAHKSSKQRGTWSGYYYSVVFESMSLTLEVHFLKRVPR